MYTEQRTSALLILALTVSGVDNVETLYLYTTHSANKHICLSHLDAAKGNMNLRAPVCQLETQLDNSSTKRSFIKRSSLDLLDPL